MFRPVLSQTQNLVDFLKESRRLYDGPNRSGCRDGVPSLPRSIVTDHGEATIDLEILTRTTADVTFKYHEPRTYTLRREHVQKTLYETASYSSIDQRIEADCRKQKRWLWSSRKLVF